MYLHYSIVWLLYGWCHVKLMLSQHIPVTPYNHAPWHVTSCHLFSLLGVGTCENCFDHLKERHRQKKLSVIFFERMGRAIFNRTNIGVVSKASLGKNFWEMGWSAYGHSWAHRNHQELNWTQTCLSLCLLTWWIASYKYVLMSWILMIPAWSSKCHMHASSKWMLHGWLLFFQVPAWDRMVVPHRSTTYGSCLQYVALDYCNNVEEVDMKVIVTACRGGLVVINYYKQRVLPQT